MKWPIVLAAGSLEVRFDRCGDRIEHCVWVNGIDVPLLASVEGSHDAAWPASPPFQELTLQHVGGRPIALLVGRAGTSHWSACVEPAAESERISFDVACRIQHQPQWLGCRYRFSAPTFARLQSGMIAVICGNPSVNIVGSTEPETMTDCQLRSDEIEIIPTAGPLVLPATIRWRFTLSIVGR